MHKVLMQWVPCTSLAQSTIPEFRQLAADFKTIDYTKRIPVGVAGILAPGIEPMVYHIHWIKNSDKLTPLVDWNTTSNLMLYHCQGKKK